jgi:hypothetical protein
LLINADGPYAFFGGGEGLHRVHSMMREGDEKRTRWNGIAYRNASKSRDVWRFGAASRGWLKEDFMLISKLPLYSDWISFRVRLLSPREATALELKRFATARRSLVF